MMTNSEHNPQRGPLPARLTALVLALSLCAALPAARAADQEAGAAPKEVVKQLTNKALDILRKKDISVDEKRHEIENVVYQYVDFNILSRLVLARNWRKFSKPQQDEFVQEFKKHLSLTYGKNIENYHNEGVEIFGDREEPGGDWTVQTNIVRGGSEKFRVDYRLRKEDGQWKVIDIVIEGVSLVANFRSQFQDIVSSGGPEKVLKLLHEKNASGESLKS
jgi:phospholipid transport system substrate-binding protein